MSKDKNGVGSDFFRGSDPIFSQRSDPGKTHPNPKPLQSHLLDKLRLDMFG